MIKYKCDNAFQAQNRPNNLIWENIDQTMTLSDAIRKRLTQLCAERGITINRLADICGITQSTFGNMFTRKNTTPTVSIIKKICDGLEINLKEFFDTDYFNDLEQEIK